ncbi:MAG: hypothetical protein IJ762_11990 [Bacteroidaceae bacterium]|nr:hypothetical protein [Bacteroidaceae bacterium]
MRKRIVDFIQPLLAKTQSTRLTRRSYGLAKMCSFLAMLLFATSGWAVNLTLTVADGSYTTSSGNYVNSWTSTSTPAVTVTASANNMDKRQTENFLWHSGSSQSGTYTFAVPEGYLIKSITLTARANSNDQTVTIGSTSKTFTSSLASELTVSGLSSASTVMTLAGSNTGLLISQIQLTVEVDQSYVVPVASLSELSNTKAYRLTTARGSLGVSGTTLVADCKSEYTASNFALISYSNAYYLYSVEANAFINASGVATNEGEPVAITIMDLGSSTFQLRFGSNAINVSTGYAPGLIINSWTTLDDGNQYTITEADAFDPTAALNILSQYGAYTYVTSLSSLSNSKSYVVTNARGTWNIADGATSMTTASGVDRSATSQKFALLTVDDTYFIYSVNAGKFLTSSNTLSDTPTSVSISSTGNTSYPFFFSFDSSHNINVNGAGTVLIDNWSTVDAGNSNAIIEAGAFDATAPLAVIDAYLHPTNISYTVNVLGGVAATVTVKGQTYANGATFNVSSALTADDVTVNVPSGYTLVSKEVSATGDERTITVLVQYNLSTKTKITDLSTLSATKGYLLNNRYGCGIMMGEDDGAISLRNLAQSNHAVTSETFRYPYVPTDKNHVWQLLSEDGKYYLYNPGQQKFAFFNQTNYVLVYDKKPINVDAITEDEATVAFAFNTTTTSYYYASAATQFSWGPVRWWYSNSTDTQWEIMESDFTNLPTTRTYQIVLNGTDEISDFDVDDEYTLNGSSFCWSDGDEATADILLEADQIEVPAYTGFRSSVTLAGNVITITYIGEADLTALNAALVNAKQYAALIGTGVGKYTASSSTQELLTSAIDAAQEYVDAESVPYSEQSNINTVIEGMNTAIAALTLNMPETAKYYRMKGPHQADGQYYYVSAENAGSTNLNSLNGVADATNIFYLTPDSKLLSYYNPTYLTGTLGQYQATNLSEPSSTDAFTLAVSAGNLPGTYRICAGEEYYLYNWYYTWTGQQVLVSNEVDDIRCQWTLEQVDTLPVNLTQVGDEYYSTLYLPVAVKVEGATVYTPAINGTTVKLTTISDGVVPANTAVIVKGSTATADAVITTTTKTLTSGMAGSIANINASDVNSPYVFSYRNGVLGFFRFVGEILAGNKAYFSGAANVEGFVIDWDNITDAISGVEAQRETEAVYDLTGRREEKATQGIYVKNGKKYIVK